MHSLRKCVSLICRDTLGDAAGGYNPIVQAAGGVGGGVSAAAVCANVARKPVLYRQDLAQAAFCLHGDEIHVDDVAKGLSFVVCTRGDAYKVDDVRVLGWPPVLPKRVLRALSPHVAHCRVCSVYYRAN